MPFWHTKSVFTHEEVPPFDYLFDTPFVSPSSRAADWPCKRRSSQPSAFEFAHSAGDG
jgi:hypothetical protein